MRTALCMLTVVASLGIPGRAEAVPNQPAPRDLAASARPYSGQLTARRPTGLVDRTGVRMYRPPAALNGNKIVDHPVAQAQYGLVLLNTYRVKHDNWFLDRAERQARRIISKRVTSRGAWWFPYPFDYALGANMNYTMRRPWYSAMAQGQALSLFIRLHQATGDDYWRVAADRAFHALRLGFTTAGPWATHRDGNDRLWLEEYPAPTRAGSGRVLNGHIFAMYGLWDYWMVTRSRVAANLFADSAATVRRYVLTNFRNPGWASSYALRGLAPSVGYHIIHVDQLLHLHAMTGHAVYARMAEVLQADFPAPVQRVRVVLGATRHTGIRFRSTSAGVVLNRKLIRLARPSLATVDHRRRIGGQPGYWYRVTSGSLRGLWVQEVPGVRATLTPVATMNYLHQRSVRMTAGRHRVCTAVKCSVGRVRGTTRSRVGSIGWIRGQRAVKLIGGPLRGWWLPLTSRSLLT